MSVPVRRPAPSASGQARPHFVKVTASTAAEVPAAKPAERSISPRRRTNTSPMASTMIAVPWLRRLAKLRAVKNVPLSSTLKSATRTMRPRTAGSDPTSPPLTLLK